MKIKFPDFRNGPPLLKPTARRHRQQREEVFVQSRGLGRAEWVLSRPLYRFARADLKSVPRNERGRALEIQIRQWAPFPRAGHYVLWDQDAALVWMWDAAAIEAAMAAAGVRKDGVAVIPESVLKERRSQGVHLVACMEGYEGLAWRDGGLHASRWWPELPTAEQWANFQRDAGVPPEVHARAVPAPMPAHLLERAWGKPSALDAAATYEALGTRWAVPLVGFCLVAATLWYGIQWVKVRQAIAARNGELETLTQRAGPLMSARGEALEALAKIESLQAAIGRYPDAASLMAGVASAIPADGTHLREWEFANGKLKLLVSTPGKLAASDFIKRFESTGLFREVQATPVGDPTLLALSMDVVAVAELPRLTTAGVAGR